MYGVPCFVVTLGASVLFAPVGNTNWQLYFAFNWFSIPSYVVPYGTVNSSSLAVGVDTGMLIISKLPTTMSVVVAL